MNEQAKRTGPRAPIEIQVEYEHLNALASDYTKNLSKGGAFIQTEVPLPIGTQCFFTLSIPFLQDPLRLEAEVKHHDTKDGEVGMGIGFVFSSEEESQAFHVVLDRIMFDHLGEQLFNRLKAMKQVED